MQRFWMVMAAALALASSPAPAGLLFIGTQEKAILAARLDPAIGRLDLIGPAAEAERPTWIATDPQRPLLFSVSELGNAGEARGSLLSFAIDPVTGKLKPISKVDSGGGGPTHLSYDPRVKTVFVAHFGGGQVAAFPVAPDGSLSAPSSVQTDVGSGPAPNQKIPHAHAAHLDPGGQFVVTPDMGADRIFVRRFDAATGTLAPADPESTWTGAATGPRHIAFAPDGRFLFVLTELSAEVRSFRWDAKTGRIAEVQRVALDEPGYAGPKSAAEIGVSSDGRFVYASNRGQNTIHVFAVDPARGTLKLVQKTETGGKRPRTFAIDPTGRSMLVGNQDSQTISVLRIDRASGRLALAGRPIPTGSYKPVSFAFYSPAGR